MKKVILAAALLAGVSTQASAWTYRTDDGRTVTTVQENRDGAYCNMVTGGRNDGVWRTCMLSRGYIIEKCGWMDRCF